METSSEVWDRVRKMIGEELWNKFRSETFLEMANEPELAQWADELKQADADWWAAEAGNLNVETDDEVYVNMYRAIVINLPGTQYGTPITATCPYCVNDVETKYGDSKFICPACNQVTAVYETEEKRDRAIQHFKDNEFEGV
jgi:hypothetical protein